MGLISLNKTEKNVIIDQLKIFIMSDPGLGKSTFASESKAPYFAECEPGLRALDVYKTPIAKWSDFKQLVNEFEKGGHPYKTLVIDSIDAAVGIYSVDACAAAGAQSIAEIAGGYGKGDKRMYLEFFKVIRQICSMPYGVIFLSHVKEKSNYKDSGVSKTIPNIPEDVSDFMLAQCDLVLFGEVDRKSKEHVLRTKPGGFHLAKDRYGFLPDSISFRYSEYRND